MQNEHLDRYPKLPRGTHRTLYFCGANPVDVEALTQRGYTCVEVNTLPRNTEMENATYLLAKAQGVEEGTIELSDKAEFDLLQLQMKAYGLLDKRSTALNLHVSGDAKSLDSLFGWGTSRHTLADNSTVVASQRLVDAVLPKGQKDD